MSHTTTFKVRQLPIVLFCAFGLISCGGGGSSNSSTAIVIPTPSTPTPTPTPTGLTLDATLNGTNIFQTDEQTLSFEGNRTLTLEVISTGPVDTVVMTQTAGPLIEYGRVSIPGFGAGGSIVLDTGSENFEFTFPDDDDTPRRALFPKTDGPLNLQITLPSVAANMDATLSFSLSDGDTTQDIDVPFTITAGTATVKSGLNISVEGQVSNDFTSDQVIVFDLDSNVQGGLKTLGQTRVSSDGTYALSIDRNRINGDSILVFNPRSETGHNIGTSYLVRNDVIETGAIDIIPISGNEVSIIADLD